MSMILMQQRSVKRRGSDSEMSTMIFEQGREGAIQGKHLRPTIPIDCESIVEVVEDVSHVSPPPGSVPTTSLPVTFFDILYLVTIPVDCNWMQRLFFYESKHPASDFIRNILPGLKHLCRSLCKESTADFDHLVGDHARDHGGFHALVLQKPPAIDTESPIVASESLPWPFKSPCFPMQGFP
ncbi:hypothetical protein F3Y22_tig00111234pilonHSYRG00166 [Hibiscus syriacus]|uniref:Uncharacterized protein n=1 Tax=Hibiscus syriacus TaxID=106335 RepID=A0A6A2YV07_HIBSY|nr:hypothetical protein F3Y22_tig00111234pilonHSYRG00166 [Hibiscus syriacus]